MVCPMGDLAMVIRDPIFTSKTYRNLAANHGWVDGAPREPLSGALALTGAELVDAGDFRALDSKLWVTSASHREGLPGLVAAGTHGARREGMPRMETGREAGAPCFGRTAPAHQ